MICSLVEALRVVGRDPADLDRVRARGDRHESGGGHGGRAGRCPDRRRPRTRASSPARRVPSTNSAMNTSSQAPVQASVDGHRGRDQQAPAARGACTRAGAELGSTVPPLKFGSARRAANPSEICPAAKSSASSVPFVDLGGVDRAVGELAAVDLALDDLLAGSPSRWRAGSSPPPRPPMSAARSRRRRSSPSRTEPARSFDLLTASAAIALPLTAPLAMSLDFTSFLPGRASAVPLRATNSAR